MSRARSGKRCQEAKSRSKVEIPKTCWKAPLLGQVIVDLKSLDDNYNSLS